MAELDMKDAELLADQLCTIGHSPVHGARIGTAQDLCEWCKGGIFGGRPWTPLEQATELVREARNTFGDWNKAGGTTALLALFRQKFGKAEPPHTQTIEERAAENARHMASLVSRGLLAARCVHCEPGAPYCEYGGERAHAREKSERAKTTVKRKPVPIDGFKRPPAQMTPAQMARFAADEMRRKREQLERTGMA
jgi:hypothetical protein